MSFLRSPRPTLSFAARWPASFNAALSGRGSGRSASRSYALNAGIDPDELQEVFIYMRSALYIAFSKSTDAKTVSAWNAALAAMKKDGTFARIHARYFPGAPIP